MTSVAFSHHIDGYSEKSDDVPNNPCYQSSSFADKIPNGLKNCLTRFSFWLYIIIAIINVYIPSKVKIWVIVFPVILTILTSLLNDIIRYSRTRFWVSKINDRTTLVLRNKQWIKTKWSDLHTGDIIKLMNGDYVPADIILFNTDNGQQTSIETHIIDGSSQWQPKSPVDFINLPFEESLDNQSFIVTDITRSPVTEPEVSKTSFATKYFFAANLHFNDKTFEISTKNLIERYSIIHQQNFAIGGVIFSGEDCSTVRNNNPSLRITSMEKTLRTFNIYESIILIILSIFGTFYTYSNFFNGDATDIRKFTIFTFVNYISTLTPLVPLELFSLIDLLMLFNGNIFQRNIEKTYINSTDKLLEIISCNSLLISRSMILERRPILKRIFLNNQLFGDDISSRQLSHFIESETFTEENLNRHFADPALTVNEETNLFFEHISLCHSASIIIEKNKINYISRFHDDEELLKLAARSGVMLVKRTPEDSSLLQDNKIKHYKTMKLIHSCSKHPRITIIVDDGHEDDYLVLTRGIYKVMNFVVDDLQYYDKYYDQFHTEGFHVEVCAYKRLKKTKYDEFCNKISELGIADTEFQFPFVEDYIEKKMTFLAILGFEDRSRKGSLLFLSRAKQHFDQICFATTSKGMSLIITIISLGLIDGNNPSIGQIKGNSQDDVDISLTYLFERQEYDCIIITGHSLEYIVTSEYADHAAELFKKTPVLIMQRSNYLQTAAFCEYQQKILKQRVLAVGHSVYDSCYMNVANLSVAIPANEIKPNNISSDIIVSNFEQFSSLIFVGSYWLSERIDSLLKFYLSKNVLFAMIQFCFSFKANINYRYAFSCSIYPAMILFSVLSLFPHCMTKKSKSSEELMLDVTKPCQIYTKKIRLFFIFMFFTALAFIIIETIFFVIRRCSDPLTAVEFPFLVIACSFAFCTAYLISDFEKFNAVNVPGVIGSLIFFFVFMVIYTNDPNAPNVFDLMFKTREEIFLIIFWFFVALVFGYITKYFSKPRISVRGHTNLGFVLPEARNQPYL